MLDGSPLCPLGDRNLPSPFHLPHCLLWHSIWLTAPLLHWLGSCPARPPPLPVHTACLAQPSHHPVRTIAFPSHTSPAQPDHHSHCSIVLHLTGGHWVAHPVDELAHGHPVDVTQLLSVLCRWGDQEGNGGEGQRLEGSRTRQVLGGPPPNRRRGGGREGCCWVGADRGMGQRTLACLQTLDCLCTKELATPRRPHGR